MAEKIEDLVVYIDRNAAYFYGGVFESVVSVKLPATMVKDLEIVDRKALISLLTTSVKVTGAANRLVVVFSDQILSFKEYPANTNKGDLPALEKDFLGSVPFNSVSGKLISTQKGYQGVAVNSDLANIFIDVMESKGFKLDIAVPGFVTGLDFRSGLTEKIAKEVLSKREELSVHSLMGQHSVPVPVPVQNVGPAKPKQKSSMPILLGVFAVLIVILIFVMRGQ